MFRVVMLMAFDQRAVSVRHCSYSPSKFVAVQGTPHIVAKIQYGRLSSIRDQARRGTKVK